MITLQLLLYSFIIPREFGFNIGDFALSPYRILLISYMPYVLWLILSQHKFKWRTQDSLALAVCIWPSIALMVNTSIAASLESGGIYFLELFVPYFLARATINSYTSLKLLSKTVLNIALILCVLGIIDIVTNSYFTRQIAASLTGSPFNANPEFRMGLRRAMGPTDHPIIFGTLCVLGMSMAYYLAQRKTKYYLYLGACIVGMLSSLSSAPLLAGAVQLGLILWAKAVTGNKQKWLILCLLVIIAYAVVDLLSNRDPFRVMFSYLLFSPHNGYMRYYMWVNSIQLANDSLSASLFGYGFSREMFSLLNSDYMRQLMSSTVDSYWLVLLLRYGWTMLILHLALVASILAALHNTLFEKSDIKLRRLLQGYFFSIIALTLVACTVHYWAQVSCVFMIFLGATVAITTAKQNTRRTLRSHAQPVSMLESQK